MADELKADIYLITRDIGTRNQPNIVESLAIVNAGKQPTLLELAGLSDIDLNKPVSDVFGDDIAGKQQDDLSRLNTNRKILGRDINPNQIQDEELRTRVINALKEQQSIEIVAANEIDDIRSSIERSGASAKPAQIENDTTQNPAGKTPDEIDIPEFLRANRERSRISFDIFEHKHPSQCPKGERYVMLLNNRQLPEAKLNVYNEVPIFSDVRLENPQAFVAHMVDNAGQYYTDDVSGIAAQQQVRNQRPINFDVYMAKGPLREGEEKYLVVRTGQDIGEIDPIYPRLYEIDQRRVQFMEPEDQANAIDLTKGSNKAIFLSSLGEPEQSAAKEATKKRTQEQKGKPKIRRPGCLALIGAAVAIGTAGVWNLTHRPSEKGVIDIRHGTAITTTVGNEVDSKFSSTNQAVNSYSADLIEDERAKFYNSVKDINNLPLEEQKATVAQLLLEGAKEGTDNGGNKIAAVFALVKGSRNYKFRIGDDPNAKVSFFDLLRSGQKAQSNDEQGIPVWSEEAIQSIRATTTRIELERGSPSQDTSIKR